MAEKILLIAPRWMTQAMTRQKIEFYSEKYPRAKFILLASAPLENAAISTLILPPLEPQKIAQFARKLRRIRFRRAVVLSDVGRGDVGYGEAKFWAFLSNARWRAWGGEPLKISSELKAKRKVTLIFGAHILAMACEILKVPRRTAVLVRHELWNSARTFVYLQHAMHQHGAAPGRVLLIGERWDEDTARRCGWQIATEKTGATLGLCEKSVVEKANFLNADLLCYAGVAADFQHPETARQVENRAAFFDETARDIWLVAK